MTKKTPLAELKHRVDTQGMRYTARAIEISHSYISAILKGSRPITKAVAKKLGFKETTEWEKI